MNHDIPQETAWKHRELMLKVARKPGFCCCCVCLPRDDRRRARRVFRLTRKIIRVWDKEREAGERALITPDKRP